MRWIVLVLLVATPALAQQEHDPIRIDEASDFTNPQNGVRSGAGTAADPYVINDWVIRRPLVDLMPSQAAVLIEGTDAHVVVRGIQVHQPFDIGVAVVDAANVTIERLEVRNAARAVYANGALGLRMMDLDLIGNGPDDFAGGVLIHRSHGVALRNVVVDDGKSPGVMVTTSSGVLLEGLRVTGHDQGLRLHGVQGLVLVGVQADHNRGDGVRISNVTGLQVLGLSSNDHEGSVQSGRGIVIWDTSGTMQNVVANRNGGGGLRVFDSRIPLTTGRFLDNQGAGLRMQVDDARVEDVESHGNSGDGLAFFAGDGRGVVRLVDVDAHDNGGSGVFVQGMDGMHLADLRTQRNGGPGIDVRVGGNLTILGSRSAENRGDGVLLFEVRGGQVVDNRATGNGKAGFVMHAATGLRVVNNSAEANTGHGFLLDGTGLHAIGNDARGNGGHGILVPAGANATLRANHASGNQQGDLTGGTHESTPAPFALAAVLLALALRRRPSTRAAR